MHADHTVHHATLCCLGRIRKVLWRCMTPWTGLQCCICDAVDQATAPYKCTSAHLPACSGRISLRLQVQNTLRGGGFTFRNKSDELGPCGLGLSDDTVHRVSTHGAAPCVWLHGGGARCRVQSASPQGSSNALSQSQPPLHPPSVCKIDAAVHAREW